MPNLTQNQGLAVRPFPPQGNSFTTGAAVQLGHETGNLGELACLSIIVQNPLTGDTGVAQTDCILVGSAPTAKANVSGNVVFWKNLQPGEEIEIFTDNVKFVWVKAASNTPICKYRIYNAPVV